MAGITQATGAGAGHGEASLGGAGKFQLLDLVTLSSDVTTVGVLVKIDTNSRGGSILTKNGLQQVRESDIQQKLRNELGC